MTSEQLFEQIRAKRSFLSVGLDSDMARIPEHLLSKDDPIFEFNKAIVDATADLVIAFKANLAFYEVHGASGWNSLIKTFKYIRKKYPEILLIADAKRGDIPSTARMYAKTYYQTLDSDALTVSPYLGFDSIEPYLSYEKKWIILLAITSNKSFSDFQLIESKETGRKLFEEVIEKSQSWGTHNNIMFVVGATHPEVFDSVRKLAPDHFLLVPGVGEQGGNLEQVASSGMNKQCGLIVNSSRSIIYADITGRFAEASRQKALALQKQMEHILLKAGLLN